MKKIISLVIVLSIICSSFTISYADCTPKVAEAIDWLIARGHTDESWYGPGDPSYIDLDGKYGAQCSDLVTAYMNWLYCGATYPDQGYLVYDANYYPTAAGWNTERWTIISNYAEFVPAAGDIFVGAGHVGIVLESYSSASAKIIDQNSIDPNDTVGHSGWIHNVNWKSSGPYGVKYFIRYNHFSTGPSYYTIDVNGFLDSVECGNTEGFGTFDIYINGRLERDDATDFCAVEAYPAGTTWAISDIKPADGKAFGGYHAGTRTGTVGGYTNISLIFGTVVDGTYTEKKATWGGHTYIFVDRPSSWYAAKVLSEKRGGYLVAVNTAAEEAFLREWTDYAALWIGATDEGNEGKWRWISKDPFNYSNWYPGEPNNYIGPWEDGEQFAMFREGKEGGWNDVAGYPGPDNLIPFICEINGIAAEGIAISQTKLALTVGEQAALTVKVDPADCTEKIVWESMNEAIATVSDDGVVTAVKEGRAYIMVTVGNYSKLCLVTVKSSTVKLKKKSVDRSEDGTATLNLGVSDDRETPAPILVLAAAYDGGGRMIGLQIVPREAASGETEHAVEFADCGEDKDLKAFCVTEDLAPLANTVNAYGSTHYSKWVLEKDVPAGAEIVKEKWTYTFTETQDSYSSELDGWTKRGFDWVKTGKDGGTHTYASFPGGFNTEHALYGKYDKAAYVPKSGTEDGVEWKTDVTSTNTATYIYWHWTPNQYELTSGNYNVLVEDHYCWLNGREYYNFRAFESKTDYSHTDPNGASDAEVFYAWMGDPADGSWWWYRFPVYAQTYAKFEKMYHFVRITEGLESETEIVPGDGIGNVQHWVKYIIE